MKYPMMLAKVEVCHCMALCVYSLAPQKHDAGKAYLGTSGFQLSLMLMFLIGYSIHFIQDRKQGHSYLLMSVRDVPQSQI